MEGEAEEAKAVESAVGLAGKEDEEAAEEAVALTSLLL